MALRLLVFGLAFLLAGCETLRAVTFQKADMSGVGVGEVRLEALPVASQRREELVQELARYLATKGDLPNLLGSCGVKVPDTKSGTAAKMDTGSIVSGAITVGAQWLQGRIDRIVAGSTASYSAAIIVKPDDLAAAQCLLVTRRLPLSSTSASLSDSTSTPTLGMLAILKLDHAGVELASTATKAFRFRPVYLRMLNSVAITRNDSPPVVDVAAALSIHALAEPDQGIERFTNAGQSVVTVPDVVIGPAQADGTAGPAKRCALHFCNASTPVTYPLSRGSLVLTVALGERGVTGFGDKENAKAQVAALKEALGPVVEARYKKE
jgi:hypothetical protein